MTRTQLLSIPCSTESLRHTLCDGRVAFHGMIVKCLCSCHKPKRTTRGLKSLLP